MPVVAIVAAVGTVSAGAALGGVLGGIMIAGGVMSGLGAITGNKTLSMLGAVASMGAGLGAAFGLAGAANGAWNAAVGGADSALGVTGNSFMAQGGSLGGVRDALGLGGGSSVKTDGLVDAAMQSRGEGLGAEARYLAGQSPSLGAQGMGSSSAFTPLPAVAPSATPASGPSFSGMASQAPPVFDGYKVQDLATQAPAGSSFIDKSMAFIKGNPEVVKIGSGLISGAMGSYERQRQEQAAIDQDNQRRQRMNDSIINQGITRPTARI